MRYMVLAPSNVPLFFDTLDEARERARLEADNSIRSCTCSATTVEVYEVRSVLSVRAILNIEISEDGR
jgi:hypothetical protein